MTVTSTGTVSYTGQTAAVVDGSGPGTLCNYGLISSGQVAISLAQGGLIENYAGGVVQGFEGILLQGSATVDNAGLISGFGAGIYASTGVVTNEQAGMINGGVSMVTGFIINKGTIARSIGDLVQLNMGGTVSNLGTAAYLTGANVLGVLISGAAGTVTNQGMIDGVSLQSGGIIVNQGYIATGTALYAAGVAGAAGTIDNSGTIIGAGLSNGGKVINEAGGTISGYSDGINLAAGGSVYNYGTVLGVGGLAGELNPGQLGGAGVYLAGAGSVTNASHALLQGTRYGIELAGSAGSDLIVNYGVLEGNIGFFDETSRNTTFVDEGTIIGTGGVALQFGGGNDVLVLGAGAALDGKLVAGTGTDTVEITANPTAGSINWLGDEFTGNVTFVNEAAVLTLTGSNTITPSEILDNVHTLTIGGTLDAFGTLDNSGKIFGATTLGGRYPYYVPLITPAVLDNAAGGSIISTLGPAVSVLPGYYPTTIDNAGVIENTASGGTAISFSAGQANLLILHPGSKITGLVDGGATGSVGTELLLASGAPTGTIDIGSSFINFAGVTIEAGARWDINAATFQTLTNDGTVILDPTTMTVNGTLAGTGLTDIDDSDLILRGAVSSGQRIDFLSSPGVLTIADLAGFAGAITGFSANDTIDLSSFAYNTGHMTVTMDDGMLAIANSSTHALIQIGTIGGPEYFHLSSDGMSGTDIIENNVPCFLAGTSIKTPDGETAVEDLKIGDVISIADGGSKPVKWIGRRCYAAPLPDDPDVIPVLIKAGALADNVPARDLYVSPMHAVGVDGRLVPAGALVNDVSVLSCKQFTAVEYFHIETEDHSIIIANGAPAETFIDQDSRRMFDNAAEYAALYPHTARLSYHLCAPRLEFGAELEGLRRKIAWRAGVALDQPAATGGVVGFLEVADRQNISGWAYAPSQPNVPVRLEIYNRGALLARTIANIPRPDVKLAGFGNGRCGFSIALPAPLPALMRHEISVRAAGAPAGLAGSPSVIDPAIAHDLLKSGGLRGLLDAAVKGLGSAREVAYLGTSLEEFARQLRLKAATPRPRRAAVGRGERPLALMLDEAWPTVTLDAGSNAIVSHVKAFQQLGFDVIFAATGGPPQGDAACAGHGFLQALGVECAGAGAAGLGAATEDVIRAAAARGVSVVYLHRLAAASAYGGLARQYAPNAQVIFSVADLHHLRLARQAEITRRPDLAAKARAVRAAEFWTMQMADCVITHSRYEADYLRKAAPHINVHIVPWAVPAGAAAGAGHKREHIAFIGGAGHAPNVDAVLHLAQEIMPLVWRRKPLIRCLIAGQGWAENFFSKLDLRIVNLGHQSSLTPLLRRVKLTVAPLRFGAGIKGKVLESMAAGTPCAMSHVAAEGLRLDGALQACTGDGADLAEHILALYGNKKLNHDAAKSGLDMVETYFSASATRKGLAGALGMPAGHRPEASEMRLSL